LHPIGVQLGREVATGGVREDIIKHRRAAEGQELDGVVVVAERDAGNKKLILGSHCF
jgi:hypothetical protein